MEFAIVLVAIIVSATATYVFQLWIRHQRRMMVHRERLAAIDKGIEVPPLEQEIERRSWNIQRLLLFAGLVWITIGGTAFLVLDQITNQSFRIQEGYSRDGEPLYIERTIPNGVQWIAVGPIGIGLAHVIVYQVGRKKEGR